MMIGIWKAQSLLFCTEVILEVRKYAGTEGAKSMYRLVPAGFLWSLLWPCAQAEGRFFRTFLTSSSWGTGGREQVATRKLLCLLLVGCGWGTHKPRRT